MTHYEELEDRIENIERRIDELLGRARGPITMKEYRLACERKDRATMRAYLRQCGEENPLPRTGGNGRNEATQKPTPPGQQFRVIKAGMLPAEKEQAARG